MRLTETHIISKNHKLWNECDRLCFASKNLYNYALYRINCHYETTGEYLNYNKIAKQLSQEKQIDYISLRAKVSQQTLMNLDLAFKAFFKLVKKYNSDSNSLTGQPQKPRFKNKNKGRFITVFTSQAISKIRSEYISIPNTTIKIKSNKTPQQIRIVPNVLGTYKIEIVYIKEAKDLIKNTNYAGIDIGVNNLATVVFNTDQKPFIINGKPLKSINQFYNNKVAKMKSELPFININNKKTQKKTSNRIKNITNKRNNKITNYMHNASRILVEKMKQSNISKIVIGKNNNWKQNINIGKSNNQNFVSIPHDNFIKMITYKSELEGIEVICREESYTSKCSFLDGEEIKKNNVYLGKRVNRGTFKSKTGKKWNADCNAACNILRKEIPDAFANGIEGVVVPPIRIKSYKGYLSKTIAGIA